MEHGWNELQRFESDKGFSVVFYDESSHIVESEGMELKMMGLGNVYDKNTLVIRAFAPKTQMESSFD